MIDLFIAFFEALLDGWFTRTGRWVLSLGGWTSNAFAETLLGLLIWILGFILFVWVFVSLWL